MAIFHMSYSVFTHEKDGDLINLIHSYVMLCECLPEGIPQTKYQLIGLRERLQENPIFHREIYGFLSIFPSVNPYQVCFPGVLTNVVTRESRHPPHRHVVRIDDQWQGVGLHDLHRLCFVLR